MIGLVSSVLLYWASYRFITLDDFTDTFHPIFAFMLLTSLPFPFAMAQETSAKGWRDYEGLFDHAWSIFVRTVTAWSFTGLSGW